MKKITLLLIMILPLIGMSQLITNNAFDANTDDWLEKDGASVTFEPTEGNVALGALKLVTVTAGDKTQTTSTTVKATGSYTLTAYVKGTAGKEFHGQIWQSGGGGVGPTLIMNGSWQPYTFTVNLITGSNANVRLWGDSDASTYYFDDVYVTYNVPVDFEYDFTFETAGDTEGWGPLNGTAATAAGSLDLTMTGNNPRIELDPLYYKIPSATYHTVEITLTNNSSNNLLRFFHPKSGSGTLYTEIYIAPNSGQETYVLNLTDNDGWSGDVANSGIMIRATGNTNAAAGTVKFHNIKFSSVTTEKHVFNFDGTTTEGWEMLSSNGYVSDVSGGTMTFNPQANKFAKLTLGAHHVNTATVNSIRIVLENNSTTDDQIKISLPNGGNITENVTLSPSAETTYEISLMGLTGWTGELSQLAISFLNSNNPQTGRSSGGGTFVINKIEFYDDGTLSTDIEYPSKQTLVLYPNPVSNTLNFSNEVVQVAIYDVLGQQIALHSNVSTIDTSNFKAGSYIARIVLSNGNTITKKFLKN